MLSSYFNPENVSMPIFSELLLLLMTMLTPTYKNTLDFFFATPHDSIISPLVIIDKIGVSPLTYKRKSESLFGIITFFVCLLYIDAIRNSERKKSWISSLSLSRGRVNFPAPNFLFLCFDLPFLVEASIVEKDGIFISNNSNKFIESCYIMRHSIKNKREESGRELHYVNGESSREENSHL